MTVSGAIAEKSIDEQFRDWEAHVFGFGYGTGEEHILPALKRFFAATIGSDDNPRLYSYQRLESEVGPVVAWLFINTLCHNNMIEYGVSPRFGWLTPKGERLRDYLASKSGDDLIAICCDAPEDSIRCGPDYCNCGPDGYLAGRKCRNQFFD